MILRLVGTGTGVKGVPACCEKVLVALQSSPLAPSDAKELCFLPSFPSFGRASVAGVRGPCGRSDLDPATRVQCMVGGIPSAQHQSAIRAAMQHTSGGGAAAEEQAMTIELEGDGFSLSLREFWASGKLCDVLLRTCDGIELACHRVVLAASSGFFRALFLGAGACMSEGGRRIVDIRELTGPDLHAAIDAVYCQRLVVRVCGRIGLPWARACIPTLSPHALHAALTTLSLPILPAHRLCCCLHPLPWRRSIRRTSSAC